MLWHFACAFDLPTVSGTSLPLIVPPTSNSQVFHCCDPAKQHLQKKIPQNPFTVALTVLIRSKASEMNSTLKWVQKLQSTKAAPEHHKVRLVELPCISLQTLLEKWGRCHFSVTAAAMGVRMVPRAVAASSSISVFSRLITHSMASRPWSRTNRGLVHLGVRTWILSGQWLRRVTLGFTQVAVQNILIHCTLFSDTISDFSDTQGGKLTKNRTQCLESEN